MIMLQWLLEWNRIKFIFSKLYHYMVLAYADGNHLFPENGMNSMKSKYKNIKKNKNMFKKVTSWKR